tara:strand:- start:1347 stop:1991 length:645 start_codon:yes stop_codon:yes gene_type:complete
MANINGAFGLRPISKVGQNSNSTGVSGYSSYEIASGNTNAIYFGSPVIPLSTGYIDVVGAAAGGTVGLLGAFMGCKYVASTTGKPTWSNYWPGSGADSNHPVEAFVADDPMQMFVIATDASWTSKATARAAVFANANFGTGTSGSTTTGMSSATLSITLIATTAALHLRIMGWEEDPSNMDFTAAGVGAIVRLNNHYHSPNGAIVAGTPSTTGV